MKVTYEDLGGRRYDDEILLDLGVYRNIQCVDTRGLTDIYTKSSGSPTPPQLTSSGRIKVLPAPTSGTAVGWPADLTGRP